MLLRIHDTLKLHIHAFPTYFHNDRRSFSSPRSFLVHLRMFPLFSIAVDN
jgi:hypothetical protein